MQRLIIKGYWCPPLWSSINHPGASNVKRPPKTTPRCTWRRSFPRVTEPLLRWSNLALTTRLLQRSKWDVSAHQQLKKIPLSGHPIPKDHFYKISLSLYSVAMVFGLHHLLMVIPVESILEGAEPPTHSIVCVETHWILPTAERRRNKPSTSSFSVNSQQPVWRFPWDSRSSNSPIEVSQLVRLWWGSDIRRLYNLSTLWANGVNPDPAINVAKHSFLHSLHAFGASGTSFFCLRRFHASSAVE